MTSHPAHYAWHVTQLLRHLRHEGTSSSVPTLTADEHVIRRATRSGRTTTVVTDVAVHCRTPGGAWGRHPWIDIAAVGWSAQTQTIRIHDWSDPDNPQVLDIAGDASLAALLADRVGHAHVVRRRVEFAAGIVGVVEAVLPRDGGEPVWRVHLPPGAEPDDARIDDAWRDAARQLRSLTGG